MVLCGMSLTNLILARRHARRSRSNPFRCGIPMSMTSRQSVLKEGTLITVVTELQHTVKITTLQTFNQFPSLMAADVVKSSTTLNKRTIKK